MRLGKIGQPILMNIDAFAAAASIMYLLYWFLGWFVMSVVVFLRRGFGERYLSWLNLYFGYSIIAPLVWLSTWTGSGAEAVRTGSSSLFVAYGLISLIWWVFVGLSLYHRFAIWHRDRTGRAWHTLYRGHSWIRLPFVSDEVMKKWVEPGMVLLIAYFMSSIDRPVCLWLTFSGIALLVHEQIAYHVERQRFLDMRDAQIESQNIQAALAGRPVEETRGFAIASSNQQLIRTEPGLKTAFASLSPDLRELVGVGEE